MENDKRSGATVEKDVENWSFSLNCFSASYSAKNSTLSFTDVNNNRVCNMAYRSDHFTDEYGWGPPVTWGSRDEPLAVELQEELGARMNVHTCTMLPESTDSPIVNSCLNAFMLTCECVRVHVCIYLSDLELMGDTGGEVGAGVSASSSSSSPHSSSLSGVMLLPSHTEWMETWRKGVVHI